MNTARPDPHVPLLVLLLGATGIAMFAPALMGWLTQAGEAARAFGVSGLMIGFVALLIGLATRNRREPVGQGGLLRLMLGAWLGLPLAMALPVVLLLPGLGIGRAWFEMVASFTTTGATLLPKEGVPLPLHLWRGMAGWAGGLFVLVALMAWLAPLRIGGHELRDPSPAAPMLRFERRQFRSALRRVLPWYGGLTAGLWILLQGTGVAPFPALMLAMATVSTSGILAAPASVISVGEIGYAAEALVMLALLPALSRRLFRRSSFWPRAPWRDPELRLGLGLVLLVVLLVGLRHLFGDHQPAEGIETGLPGLWRSLWGAGFTALGFLTTTGFADHAWLATRDWPGLAPPGMVLLGLVLVGGGAATTAGGVKLLRIVLMARLGRQELERMVHPHVIARSGAHFGAPDRTAALAAGRAAWLFAMVFAITGVALLAGLLVSGLSLEEGLVFAIAALSTCGHLVTALSITGPETGAALDWAALPPPALAWSAMGMVLGRIEILVLVALVLARLRGE